MSTLFALDDKTLDQLTHVLSIKENMYSSLQIKCYQAYSSIYNPVESYHLHIDYLYHDSHELLFSSQEEKYLLLSAIEERVMTLCHYTYSGIVSRNYEPIRQLSLIKLSYKINFNNLEYFTSKLNQVSQNILDQEFAEILESTLSTDQV